VDYILIFLLQFYFFYVQFPIKVGKASMSIEYVDAYDDYLQRKAFFHFLYGYVVRDIIGMLNCSERDDDKVEN
jgi:hypothetical protein